MANAALAADSPGQKETFNTAARYAKVDGWKFDYTEAREKLHAWIIKRHMRQGTSNRNPTIIFTAGPYGAGKSAVLKALNRVGIINLKQFLIIDPDQIKEELPEYAQFKKVDFSNAATLVHDESGHIQEQLLEAALKAGKNIIVDGSLSAKDWWVSEFNRIRQQYPHYKLGMISVDADDTSRERRIEERALKNGRAIPIEKRIRNKKQVQESVEVLAPLTDFSLHALNNDGEVPTINAYTNYQHSYVIPGGGLTLKPSSLPWLNRYPIRSLFQVTNPRHYFFAHRISPASYSCSEATAEFSPNTPMVAGKRRTFLGF